MNSDAYYCGKWLIENRYKLNVTLDRSVSDDDGVTTGVFVASYILYGKLRSRKPHTLLFAINVDESLAFVVLLYDYDPIYPEEGPEDTYECLTLSLNQFEYVFDYFIGVKNKLKSNKINWAKEGF